MIRAEALQAQHGVDDNDDYDDHDDDIPSEQAKKEKKEKKCHSNYRSRTQVVILQTKKG
jgi:hypothetical protein